MRSKNTHIIVLAATILLMAFAPHTFAAITGDASILYTETAMEGLLWKYDYIFRNNSGSENLFAVRLYFGDSYNVSAPSQHDQWTGAWGIKSNTSLMETHTYNTSYDVAPGNQKNGFSFTVDSQLGDISYRAYFYDQAGTKTNITGMTAAYTPPANPPVAPEPVSSVLFVTGAAALVLRKRFRRRK